MRGISGEVERLFRIELPKQAITTMSGVKVPNLYVRQCHVSSIVTQLFFLNLLYYFILLFVQTTFLAVLTCLYKARS